MFLAVLSSNKPLPPLWHHIVTTLALTDSVFDDIKSKHHVHQAHHLKQCISVSKYMET